MNVLEGPSIFRCVGGFFIGALIFEFDTVRWMKCASWTSVCQIASLLLIVLIMFGSGQLPALALFSTVAFAGLILSVQTDRGPVAYVLNRLAIQYLGKISYSIYMCQWSFLMMSNIMQKPVSPTLKFAMLSAICWSCWWLPRSRTMSSNSVPSGNAACRAPVFRQRGAEVTSSGVWCKPQI